MVDVRQKECWMDGQKECQIDSWNERNIDRYKNRQKYKQKDRQKDCDEDRQKDRYKNGIEIQTYYVQFQGGVDFEKALSIVFVNEGSFSYNSGLRVSMKDLSAITQDLG